MICVQKWLLLRSNHGTYKRHTSLKQSTPIRYDVVIITRKEDLTYESISKLDPKYIFFPHWSWRVPKEIYENFECIVFHMTDLPFGRGGSPLQNLILRGFKKTKISAIKATGKLDAGPIYIKRSLSLNGSAEAIYKGASKVIFEKMIPYILEKGKELTPKPQKGEVVLFTRRKPEESRIPEDIDLDGVYDYIRMLDAEGYPPAFIETKNLIFEFKKAKRYKNFIKAEVIIREKWVR